MIKKQIILWILLGILIGGIITWIYFEYRFDISFGNDLCKKVGLKSYFGTSYFAYESGTIRTDGILCKRDSGELTVVREIDFDGSSR